MSTKRFYVLLYFESPAQYTVFSARIHELIGALQQIHPTLSLSCSTIGSPRSRLDTEPGMRFPVLVLKDLDTHVEVGRLCGRKDVRGMVNFLKGELKGLA